MENFILIFHFLVAVFLIGLILVQQGKGAEAGAAFGAGASGTVFGARGSASFLTRATAVLATLFFVTSLGLAFLSGQRPEVKSVMESAIAPELVEEGLPSLMPTQDAAMELPAVPEQQDADEVVEELPQVPETN